MRLIELAKEIRLYEGMLLAVCLFMAWISLVVFLFSDNLTLSLINATSFMGFLSLSALIVWKSEWRLLDKRIQRLEYKIRG